MLQKTKSKSLFVYHDLIAAIVKAIEARDVYTYLHSTRVSNMSEKICQLLGLSKEQIITIHIAADLHDIGKIGVSDAVLLKQGKLNNNEWQQMKMHTIIGYEIINKVNSFDEIALIIRHHHERWDGKGYPDGLKGSEIPFGSRIIAVADSIDAMLSDRSYRSGLSYKECYNEINKNSGVMYECSISNCVLNNWDDILKSRKEDK